MQIQPLDGGSPGVAAVSGAEPTTMTSPPPTPQLDGTLDGIAQALGMSTPALQGALRGGESITDLAQQRGVSRGALVQSVESRIQQRRAASGQPPLDGATLDRMVSRAFDRHRGGHRHHAHVQPPAPAAPAAATTAGSGAGGVDLLA